MIDFCIDFLAILAPFWEPSWGHVGHLFGENGAPVIDTAHFFVAFMLFSDFFFAPEGILASFWLHVGASGPHLGSILEDYGPILAPF